MKKYGKEEFIKVLKHLATYFEAYNCIGIEEMEPEKLKWRLMEYSNKPESTARGWVKTLSKEYSGILKYDRDKELFSLDTEAAKEFLYNAEILFRLGRSKIISTEEQLQEKAEIKGGDNSGRV